MAPSSALDKWLAQAVKWEDATELTEVYDALKDEAELIRVKLLMLEPLVARATARQRAKSSASDPLPIKPEPAQAPARQRKAEPGAASSGVSPKRSTWKSDAILGLLREEPHRMLTPAEVRDALRASGKLKKDEGTPTSLLLKRLVERGLAVSTDGRYGLKPSDGSPFAQREEHFSMAEP